MSEDMQEEEELDGDVQEEQEEQEEEGSEVEEESSDEDEIIVSVGDESPEESDEEHKEAPKWVKELRRKQKETARENRELRAKLNALEQPSQKKIELGEKPTLESCDYDSDEYERQLTEWHDRKRQADEEERKRQEDLDNQEKAWKDTLGAYGEKKKALKVSDFDDAEEVVLENLNQTQQGIIIQGADNPALVVYAIGKNSKKAKELAEIKDPVKFAFAVAKLEKELKVTTKKSPPQPEKRVTGTKGSSGAVDSQLKRLREEAERTGNYTKVMQYKKQKRQ